MYMINVLPPAGLLRHVGHQVYLDEAAGYFWLQDGDWRGPFEDAATAAEDRVFEITAPGNTPETFWASYWPEQQRLAGINAHGRQEKCEGPGP